MSKELDPVAPQVLDYEADVFGISAEVAERTAEAIVVEAALGLFKDRSFGNAAFTDAYIDASIARTRAESADLADYVVNNFAPRA